MPESEAVGIDTGQPSGPLGFSWPVVLGGLAIVVVAILYARSRQPSTGSGNPLATSVMLADIQGAQDVLRGEVQVQGQQTRADVAGVAGQLTDLTGLTSQGFAEAMAKRGEYYTGLSQQLNANTYGQAQQFNSLSAALAASENRLTALANAGQYGQAQQYQSLYSLGALGLQQTNANGTAGIQQYNSLAALLAAINGSTQHPPAGPDFTYAGWQQNFGKTGTNPYDVNRDNVVDVHDFGILKAIFGAGFGAPAAA